MTISKKLEKLEHSSVRLTLTVPQADVKDGYDNLIRDYTKNVQLPGFRKGHVPRDVLERKFGEGLKQEALGKLIEGAVEQVFDASDEKEALSPNERPLPYSQPRLEEDESRPEGMKLDMGADLVFSVLYDVMPEVKVGPYTGLEVEVPDVSISDEDLKRELEGIQERNSVVIDRDDDAQAANGNVLTVNYSELDETGAPLPNTDRQDFVFTLGSGYNLFHFDDEVKGMKKGETKDFDKTYAEDFSDKDLAGKTKKLRVTVTAIKEKQLPALDDDLAQDVDEKFKTLDDLKANIKERLEKDLDSHLRSAKINQILEKLMESSPVDLPESMIRIEIDSRWRNMARQFNTDGDALEKIMANSGNTKDNITEGWKPDVIKALHSRLIVDTLIKDLSFEVSDEEIEKQFETIASETNSPIDEVKNYYQADQMKEYLKEDIKERKLFDLLLEKNTIKKGKKESYLDLLSKNR